MTKEEEMSNEVTDDTTLDPDLIIPYRKLRQILPDISEDKWLELKDLALDNAMTKLSEFLGQLKRQKQLDPDFPIKIGGLVTLLEHLMDVFKIQRAIIEELKKAASKKSSELITAPRPWLGVAANEGNDKGLEVSEVLPDSAAEKGQLQRGDIIIQIGKQEIATLDGLKGTVDKFVPGNKVSVTVLRDNRKTSLTLVPNLLLFLAADIKGPNVDDKDCDANCNCKKVHKNARCQTVWQNQGEGPQGGVLFRKLCASYDASTFEMLSSKNCGLKEYF